MENTIILSIMQTIMVMILELVSPVLIIAIMVGLAISIFQTVTQIQEASLTFVPKAIVCIITLIILMPWIVNTFIVRTNELFDKIPMLIKS